MIIGTENSPFTHLVLYSSIYDGLLKLMDLAKGAFPKVEIDMESAPVWILKELITRGVISTEKGTKEDLEKISSVVDEFPEETSDCTGYSEDCLDQLKGVADPIRENSAELSIFELFGLYNSSEKKIIIYELPIRLAAENFEIDATSLLFIVLCHEMAHSANHLGLEDGKIWVNFGSAGVIDKEYFAQIYTYHYLLARNLSEHIAIMKRLSDKQPHQYGTYLNDLDKPLHDFNCKDINRRLRRKRSTRRTSDLLKASTRKKIGGMFD